MITVAFVMVAVFVVVVEGEQLVAVVAAAVLEVVVTAVVEVVEPLVAAAAMFGPAEEVLAELVETGSAAAFDQR